MTRLTQYNPFSSEPFADVFQGFLRPIRSLADDDGPRIDMDLTETDSMYLLKAEIPGVKKEDINVVVEGNTVTISAKKEEEKDVNDQGRALRKERYWGEVSRSVSFALPVNQEQATAKYENGVLTLSLPKASGKDRRMLSIT